MADNSSRKFKFISPGVFIDEIDESQRSDDQLAPVGPLVIGRTRRGPGMKPVQLNSFSEFVQTFGAPIAGAEGGDVWRGQGVASGPTYAAYAAQAYLRNNSPITVMRLLGEESGDAIGSSGVGKAGWYAGNDGAKTGFTWADESKGGAFGLCVWPSGSEATTRNRMQVTGALAAIIYCDEGRVFISGTLASGSVAQSVFGARGAGGATLSASCGALYTSNADGTITLGISKTGADIEANPTSFSKIKVSLDPASPNFIRKVLNTNPTIVNDDITTAAAQTANQGGEYWLGESYERFLSAEGVSSIGALSTDFDATSFYCSIHPMAKNNTANGLYQHDQLMPAQRGTTGWFIGQDLSADVSTYDPATQQQLFRLEALSAGIQTQEEVKVSISNIKAAKGEFELYGSFSLFVRKLSDDDNLPQIIERFDNLNLNPASPNYIAVRIGDQYEKYDAISQANKVYGRYPTQSNYIRVVMNDDLDRGGLDPSLVPFGVHGPLKSRDVSVVSYQRNDLKPWRVANDFGAKGAGTTLQPAAGIFTMMSGGSFSQFGHVGGSGAAAGVILRQVGDLFAFSGTVRFPSVPLRQQNTWGSPKANKNTYWGAWTGQSADSAFFNESIVDCLRARAANVGGYNDASNTSFDVALPIARDYTAALDSGSVTYPTKVTEISWVFSLDNVSGTIPGLNANGTSLAASSGRFFAGSRKAGSSISANYTFTGTLDAGYDRFTTVLAGGTDGWDITERDPLRLSGFPATPTEANSYQLATLKRAINIVSDPDLVQYNAISIPGVTENNTTNYLLETTQDRSDALAIIDIQNVYTPDTENNKSDEENNASTMVRTTVTDFENRNINNSYGAAYAPWLLYRDTVANRLFWGPPSIAAIGVLGSTDRNQAPWFAPAGFQRGGLSEGAGGIPVVEVSRRYNSDNRDDLYEANINPIAKFPAEGIVFWGQKTLQQTASALDRINVRRLMIFLKREISFIASRLLFGPNTQATWNTFKAQAEPLLSNVKMDFGIDEYRLILDETTTTPDLIDRNIIYAKLLVKPTKAVEFFAIDFVITNSGASFED
jgi:hypothetical protein